MSRYYANYGQYLGAQRCCDLRGQGPQGPAGPTGPSAIGQRGFTGPAGESYTGPTGRGCRGPTGPGGGPIGPTGATGPSFWDASGNSAIKYINDVYIGGKLNVDGLIDPTGLILDAQASIPTGLTDPSNILWVKNTTPKTLYYGNAPFVYSAYATSGANATPFFLKENPADNQFYSSLGPDTLIGISITLPVPGKIWSINISIVETGLNQLEEDSTFNIRFYTAFNATTGFSGTQVAPFCFNGTSSYIINSSSVSVDRMAASNTDILDLTGTTQTTWYIQLNQFNDIVGGPLYGNYKFCISMFTLN